MLKNNIEFINVQSDDLLTPTRRKLAKFSDVFAFMKANGVQAPKLAYLRDWMEPLGYLVYVTETKNGPRFVTNVEANPTVRFCKGKNSAYATPAGVYSLLTRLSTADSCLHRDFSLRMLSEIHARCIPLIEQLHLVGVSLKKLPAIAQCSTKRLEYRIANARDYFNLPPFSEKLSDTELAAVFVLADAFDPNKFSLMAKAAHADLEGYEPQEESKPFPLPETSSDLDLSWMDS